MPDAKIHIPIQVTPRTVYGGRRNAKVFDVKLGNIETSGPSAKEAGEHLANILSGIAEDITVPSVMLGFDGDIWVCFRSQYGWGYSIFRPALDLAPGAMREACSMGGWSRDEALTRMREHWYANNVQNIVEGICGLCSTWRQWVCPKCQTVQRSQAPYACLNPACGHLVEEG